MDKNNNEIKIPLAFEKSTNRLVDSTMVANGDACNCYCPICNEDLRAINNGEKQKPHFKHLPESNCNFNRETYIHKLAKTILKEINEIQLPDIVCSTQSRIDLQDNFKEIVNKYVVWNNKDYKHFGTRNISLIPPKIKLKDKFSFKLKKTSEEVVFKTDEGNIRADLISYNTKNGGFLIIEPFFL